MSNIEATPNPDDQGTPPSTSPTRASIYADAEVKDVIRALRGYRVLTRAGLVEACGASHWPDQGFARALDRAIASGRVKRLSDELYELTESASHENPPPNGARESS